MSKCRREWSGYWIGEVLCALGMFWAVVLVCLVLLPLAGL